MEICVSPVDEFVYEHVYVCLPQQLFVCVL